jgi:thioredoxin-dependent peroxiredoxin
MKLSAGTTAPDFALADIHGTPVRLSAYRGKKVVLGFFRNVNCPFCNMRVHQLMKMKEAFDQHNTQMIIFFESDPKIIQRSSFHQQISPIPLLGDPEKIVYKQWGVESSMIKMMKTLFSAANRQAMKEGQQLDLPEEKDKEASMSLIPADFLIDERGVIQVTHYGAHMNDHLDLQTIKDFVFAPASVAV